MKVLAVLLLACAVMGCRPPTMAESTVQQCQETQVGPGNPNLEGCLQAAAQVAAERRRERIRRLDEFSKSMSCASAAMAAASGPSRTPVSTAQVLAAANPCWDQSR